MRQVVRERTFESEHRADHDAGVGQRAHLGAVGAVQGDDAVGIGRQGDVVFCGHGDLTGEDMTELMKEQFKLVTEIEGKCCVLLANQGPYVQGGVVACLMARHLANFEGEKLHNAEHALLVAARDMAALYRKAARERMDDDE